MSVPYECIKELIDALKEVLPHVRTRDMRGGPAYLKADEALEKCRGLLKINPDLCRNPDGTLRLMNDDEIQDPLTREALQMELHGFFPHQEVRIYDPISKTNRGYWSPVRHPSNTRLVDGHPCAVPHQLARADKFLRMKVKDTQD